MLFNIGLQANDELAGTQVEVLNNNPVQTVQNIATPTAITPDVRGATVSIDLVTSDNIAPASAQRSQIIAVPIQNPQPFLDVGSLWRLSTPLTDTSAVTIRMRGSVDSQTWDDWVAHDHFHLTEDGDMYGHLITFPAETRFIQFEIIWNTRTDVIIEAVELAFISPGNTSQSVLSQLDAPITTNDITRLDVPAQNVISRTNWGCPDGQNSPQWSPVYTPVTHLIVHHTVTPNGENDHPARVRSIWHYHTNTLGWGDIGYNFLVDANGVIYEGRAGGDGSRGAHFSCMNSNTMGIAMIGTFSNNSPSQNALNSLQNLLAWRADAIGIAPQNISYHAPSGLNLNTIAGHRDGNSSNFGCPGGTVCPGDVLYGLLPQVRQNTANIIANNIPSPTPTVTSTPTPTPTPTITPIGFALNTFTHLEFLDALQIHMPDSIEVILVIFNDDLANIYVDIDGVRAIVPVYFQPSSQVAIFHVQEPDAIDEAMPLSEPYIHTIYSLLPSAIVAATEDLLEARVGTGYDIEGIRVLDNRLEIGYIAP